jgi:CheY-like chemotaxis protein
LTALLLEGDGCDVRIVHDGPAALEEARCFRPEVVLLDIGLPGLDGYHVAHALRSEEWGRQILLIAVSGYGEDEARRRSRAAGCDHHLVKPVDPAELIDLMPGGRGCQW